MTSAGMGRVTLRWFIPTTYTASQECHHVPSQHNSISTPLCLQYNKNTKYINKQQNVLQCLRCILCIIFSPTCFSRYHSPLQDEAIIMRIQW